MTTTSTKAAKVRRYCAKFIGRLRDIIALAMVLVPLAVAPALARDLGVIGPENLPSQLGSYAAISEGYGPKTIYVLFSPGCSFSKDSYLMSQAYLDQARFQWVPVSIGSPLSDNNVAWLLANPTPRHLQAVLARPGLEEKPVSQIQQTLLFQPHSDRLISLLKPLLYNRTGRPLATPTFIYRSGNGVRIVPGSLPQDMFEEMLLSAH